jgi:hypothetical protein
MRTIVLAAALLVTTWGCGGEGTTVPMPAATQGSAGSTVPPASIPVANPLPATPSSIPSSPMATPAAPSTPAQAPAAGSSATPSQPAAGSGAMPAAMMPPALAGVSDWQPLLEGMWELPAGEERYVCVRKTLTEDVYIKEFQPIAPLGTHHTLLSVNEQPSGADGVAVCGSSANGHVTLLGSGVGENYSAGPLPDGVAYKVAKGSQLNLNLHLFNVSDKPLTGLSGTRVRTTTADRVEDFAETILAGPIQLSIPAGKSTTKGQCTIKSNTTVVAVAPHMHQLGVHLKAVVNRAGGEPVMLIDEAYDFEDQRQKATGQLALEMGDVVSVECTYQNDTGRTVAFGESSLDEMCFIGLYRYPIAGEGLICLR